MSLGNPRFSIIPAAAVTDDRIEPRDLQVLALLGRHTDNLGWCCRSQVRMAKELRCGRATVQRALARLVDVGYLEHRPQWRRSGGDAAADYRVVFDQLDASVAQEAAPESAPQGVPTDGQRVPTQDGQGVPAQDGQGVPTHERAPRLTTPDKRTPDKRTERERARDEDKDFEKALRTWPSGFADSRDEALKAWIALSDQDRVDAVVEMPRFVTDAKSVGRKLFCSLAAYLRERRWKALPERPARIDKVAAPACDQKPPPRPAKPTATQLASKHLYPDIFPEHAATDSEVAA